MTQRSAMKPIPGLERKGGIKSQPTLKHFPPGKVLFLFPSSILMRFGKKYPHSKLLKIFFVCLKTRMSKYFRNSCCEGKKKRGEKRWLWKKKKLERRTLALSPGENKPTTKQFLLHPKPFGCFLKEGKRAWFRKSQTLRRVWNEMAWASALCCFFSCLNLPNSSAAVQIRSRGNNLYKWLLGERPRQFVHANQVVPANHILFSVVSEVCKCRESEQGSYS